MPTQETAIVAASNTHKDPRSEAYVIVGNGFDIECGFRTKYEHFLNFVEETCESELFKFALMSLNMRSAEHSKLLEDVVLSEREDDYKPELHTSMRLIGFFGYASILNNFWYRHFQAYKAGEHWVDFESELSRLIKQVEDSMRRGNSKPLSLDDYIPVEAVRDLNELTDALGLTNAQVILGTTETGNAGHLNVRYRSLRDRLIRDLYAMTRAFEGYLLYKVIPNEVVSTAATDELVHLLENRDCVRVLCFNYTDTFERLLRDKGINAEFCYVHGKVGHDEHYDRMVLGIDEHLPNEDIERFAGYAPFRKYHQRIYKQTDCAYKDWLDEITTRPGTPSNLFVFGHSLAPSDKEILRSFITAQGMRTVVFYHDEGMHADLVTNLAAILGIDYVIRSIGGQKHTLEFRQQLKREQGQGVSTPGDQTPSSAVSNTSA